MPLNPADTPLYAYAQSTPIPLAGRFHAKICSVTTGRSVDAEFLVIDQQANSRPLLSFETAVQLGVMQVTQKLTTPNVTQKLTTLNLCKEAVIQKFPEVFNGIGLHKTIQAKLIVDMSVTPTAQKPRKIPYNLTRLAQKEEDRLLEAGIIEKVPDDIATTWCTNPVIVPKPHKPGHIRYCSNMRVPNTAIKRPITEALTVDDIKVIMSGSTVFSTLDMNEAYHQLELHPESRHLTTFYGTQGRLRYNRLNFGTISAQDIFDKAVDDTIQGLQGVVHIRDDFIIHGCSQEQHDERLIAFLNRMKESGLTLCPKKCKIAVPSVEFFGVVFEKKGTSPAPSKVEALHNMSRPKDVGEVRSLLGMAQYSAQYVPNFSSITAPLRNLTKSSVKWKWGQEEEEAFNKIKHSLSEDSVLGYYELNQPTKLMVDAGPEGLGLILAQKKSHGWQAVVCHSRSLTPAERNYSQMEREALAIRWACERCYVYLIGGKFTIITDHQPLLPMLPMEYADTKRRTETHDLHPGDIVIAKQRKTTKITPPYDPTPYRVETVNGSMVTAEKLSSGKKVTRDSSHFKQIKEEGEINQEQYKEQFEEEEKQFETEDKDLNPTPSGADNRAMDNDNSLPIIREDVVTEECERPRRSGRTTKKPAWMKDFVSS